MTKQIITDSFELECMMFEKGCMSKNLWAAEREDSYSKGIRGGRVEIVDARGGEEKVAAFNVESYSFGAGDKIEEEMLQHFNYGECIIDFGISNKTMSQFVVLRLPSQDVIGYVIVKDRKMR